MMVAITPRVITRLINPLSNISRNTSNLAVNRCYELLKPPLDHFVAPAIEKLSSVPLRVHNTMSADDHKLAGLYKQARTTASAVLNFSDKVPVLTSLNALGDSVGGLSMSICSLSSHLRHPGPLATQFIDSNVKPIVGEVYLFTAERVFSPILSVAFEYAKPYIRSVVVTELDDLLEVHYEKQDSLFIDIALGRDENELPVLSDMSNDTTLIEDDKARIVKDPTKKTSVSSEPEEILSLGSLDRSLGSSMHAVDAKELECPKSEPDKDSFMGPSAGERSLSSSIHAVNTKKGEAPVPKPEADDDLFMDSSVRGRSLSSSIHAGDAKKGRNAKRFFTCPPKFLPRVARAFSSSSLGSKLRRSSGSRRSAKDAVLGI